MRVSVRESESETCAVLENNWNTEITLGIFKLAIRRLQQIEKTQGWKKKKWISKVHFAAMKEQNNCLLKSPWGPVMLRLYSPAASSDMKTPPVSVDLKKQKQRIVSEGLNHHRGCANTLVVKQTHTYTMTIEELH